MKQIVINCVDVVQDKADFFVTDEDPELQVQLDVENKDAFGESYVSSITMQREELERLQDWLHEVL